MKAHIYIHAHLLQPLNLLQQTVYIFPSFHPFFFSLFYTIISHQILSSVPHIVTYASKQNAAEWGTKFILLLHPDHKWMVSGSEKQQHFHLSSLCLFYTRRGSTCKLATKGEVENNYGGDAPERNESIAWPVMKWKVDKPALCNLEIWMRRKWLFCTVNQQEKIANYKCWPSAGT